MEDINESFANGRTDPIDKEQPIAGYTNYELWLVNTDPDYFKKTRKHY